MKKELILRLAKTKNLTWQGRGRSGGYGFRQFSLCREIY